MITGNKKMDKMPDKEMRAKEKERMEKFLDHYHKARNIAIACKAYAKRRLKDIQAIIIFNTMQRLAGKYLVPKTVRNK